MGFRSLCSLLRTPHQSVLLVAITFCRNLTDDRIQTEGPEQESKLGVDSVDDRGGFEDEQEEKEEEEKRARGSVLFKGEELEKLLCIVLEHLMASTDSDVIRQCVHVVANIVAAGDSSVELVIKSHKLLRRLLELLKNPREVFRLGCQFAFYVWVARAGLLCT